MAARVAERDGLMAQRARKRQTDPLIEEIQRLRRGLNLPPRNFTYANNLRHPSRNCPTLPTSPTPSQRG
jgi:hypothetical protein